MRVPPEILKARESGALFAVSHSGGKDSQAMLVALRRIVPAEQLLVVHAHLPEVEWEGTIEHIRETIGSLPLIVTQAFDRRGEEKTLLGMVEQRGMWPSPSQRQCTSDLKRGPIEREIRRYLKANPRFGGQVVSCMGLRAEESASRSRRPVLKVNERNSLAGRTWLDWLPIHGWSTKEVFAAIAAAGEEPHWVYARGMTRKSCCFCIMSSQGDLRTAAHLVPALYRRYVATEKRIGHTLNPAGTPLDQVTGIPAEMAGRADREDAREPLPVEGASADIEIEEEGAALALVP